MRSTLFSHFLVLSLISSLALAQSAPTVRQPGDALQPDVLQPETSGRLEPRSGNETFAFPPKRRFVGEKRPDHSFFPPGERARRKGEMIAHPDLPSARRLQVVDTGDDSSQAVNKTLDLNKALTVRAEFEGLNFVQGGLTFPPDTNVAASATRVLEATNVALRLSRRGGGGAQVRSLDNFFGVPTRDGFHFDPKVFYDRLSDRFYLMDVYADFANRQSFIYLAVSRGATPENLNAPSNWCTYRMNGRVGQSWADFPGLGMNEHWLGISVNNFNFSGSFRSVFVYALDKQALAQNAAACPAVGFHRYKAGQDGHGQIAFTVQPAQHYSTTSLADTPLFFVSSNLTLEVTNTYTLWSLVDQPGGKPGLRRLGLTGSENYTFAPNAPQKGGAELDTGDPRVQQAAFRDGVVWAVHGTGCNFGSTPGESCARVLAITPTDSDASITFEDTYGGGVDWFIWMPGIAVNGAGDVALAFQRSRANMSAGVSFAGKPASSGSFETVTKLINGRCGLDNFDGANNRTGDYVGIQTDPADDLSFWIAGEYTGNVGNRGVSGAPGWRVLGFS